MSVGAVAQRSETVGIGVHISPNAMGCYHISGIAPGGPADGNTLANMHMKQSYAAHIISQQIGGLDLASASVPG